MKAVLFCRVSSREQEDEGYSLPSQEKLLREYASKKNFAIEKVFTVSESASGKSQRKAFREMMNYVNTNNIKIIICEKTDRFTRNLKDAVTIYKWLDIEEQRQLHLVKDSLILHKNSRSQEKLNLDMRVVFAKNYVDNLSEEVKKGQKGKIENGWSPQGNAPTGYKNTKAHGKSIHVPDDNAHFITKMFELFATGNYSVNYLAEEMYSLGFRSKQGYKMNGNNIHRILTKYFYCGKFVWNGQVYQGNHEPLISVELFHTVQKLLKRKRPPKYSKHNFLFKNMLFCKECTGTVTWEKHKGIIYGHCNHYRPCTQKTWVKDHEVDTQLSSALELLQIKSPRIREWIYKGLCEKHGDTIEFQEKATTDIKSSINILTTKLDNLIDMRANGEIDKDQYLRKKQEAELEIEKYKNSINNIEKNLGKYSQLNLKVYQISQTAKEKYETLKPDQKRLLLQEIYETLALNEGRVEREYTNKYKVLQKAVDITNSSKISKMKYLPKSIFELEEKIANIPQMAYFYDDYIALRRERDSNSRSGINPTTV